MTLTQTLAITYFNVDLVYCDTEVQELDIDKFYFTTFIKLLKRKKLKHKAIMAVINITFRSV